MPYRGEIGGVAETGRDAGVYSWEWKITDFLSLCKKVGDYYTSPFFNACDGRWGFMIYPNGVDPLSLGWIDLFLHRVGGGPPKTIHITVGVKAVEEVENKKERRQEFLEGNNACYWCGFISRSELREQKSRWMPGNSFTLRCDMKTVLPGVLRDSSTQTVEEAEEERQSSEKKDSSTQTVEEAEERQSPEKKDVEEMAESLQRLLAGGENSDVLVKVQGKEFPAHRAILRARSPVFQAMFSHDMVEKQSGVVTMEDCDPASFPAFLQHVYTGSTEMISIGNVFSLYTASDKYDLSALKKACTKFIKNNLTASCICDAIALGVKHDEKDLIHCATEFFCCNALEILKTVEWQIFLQENTTIGNELLIKAFSK